MTETIDPRPERGLEHDLEREIERERRREKRFGWLNGAAQYFVAILSLVGSIGASFLAASSYPDNAVTAMFAAIPAAVLALTKIFPFEARAVAHWRKEYRLHGLLLRLRQEGVDRKTVSAEFREIEARTFDQWPLLSLDANPPGGHPPPGKKPPGRPAQ